MRFSLTLLIAVCYLSSSAQTVLINSQYATAFYTAYQMPDSSEETDTWRIAIDMKNMTIDDLYYARADDEVNNVTTIPYYLKVRATNALSFKADAEDVAASMMIATSAPQQTEGLLPDAVYFYGAATMIAAANKTNIFRVKPVRIGKSFTVTTKQGERPEMEGEFTRKLLPINKMDLLRNRRK